MLRVVQNLMVHDSAVLGLEFESADIICFFSTRIRFATILAVLSVWKVDRLLATWAGIDELAAAEGTVAVWLTGAAVVWTLRAYSIGKLA